MKLRCPYLSGEFIILYEASYAVQGNMQENLMHAGIDKTIMFVDMSNSTGITARDTEPSWIANFSAAFSAILEGVPESGSVVKFTGDGFMIAFEIKDVTECVNYAIAVQEKIKRYTDESLTSCTFSIGIASGRVRPFQTSNFTDYLGSTVNRAARLCHAAASWAIIIDDLTKRATSENMLESAYGSKYFKYGIGYISEPITTILKGLKEPIVCYEVQWDDTKYNLSPDHHTFVATVKGQQQDREVGLPRELSRLENNSASSNSAKSIKKQEKKPKESNVTVSPSPAKPKRGARKELERGIVKSSGEYCFIDGDDGNSYFSRPEFFAGGLFAQEKTVVYFLKRPPIVPGKNELAYSVFCVGGEYEGIVRPHPDQKMQNVRVKGLDEVEISVFCSFNEQQKFPAPDMKVKIIFGEKTIRDEDGLRPFAASVSKLKPTGNMEDAKISGAP